MRTRSPAPELDGFDVVRGLGSGGFADVFLYEQHRPRRQVAVKVLRSAALDDSARRAFDAEADLMARVSAHPFIVTIHEADVAPDGRPYFVMEYYPGDNFDVRARPGGLDVAEVLQTGVRVASAVATAHQAGVLHRDIKPANVLTSEFGRPGLTDFGIAGTLEPGVVEVSDGASIPYAPPEVLRGDRGDERGDVYSLAATIYTLLAGRPPFEIRGGDNSQAAVVRRVLAGHPPASGRPDVPGSLEHLLAQALSLHPSTRPVSALAFARALQGVERALHLAPTEIEVPAVGSSRPSRRPDGRGDVDQPDDGTQARPVQVLGSNVPSSPPRASTVVVEPKTVSAPPVADQPEASPGLARPTPTPVAGTVRKVPVVSPAEEPASVEEVGPRWHQRPVIVASWAVVVLAGVAILVSLVMARGDGTSPVASSTTVPTSALVGTAVPAPPTDVTLTALGGGVVEVSWVPVDAQTDDSYAVLVDGVEVAIDDDGSPYRLNGQNVGGALCVQVQAVRAGHPSDLAPDEPVCGVA